MTPPYLTQIELAARWRISPRTLERWRCVGESLRFTKVGSRVLYSLKDVEAYEAARTRCITDERATPAAVQPFRPKRGKRRDPVIAAIAAGSLRPRRVAN